jgi:Ca2+-transporting ATPase
MQTNHHFTGLTDAQALESRRLHGENILTPPEKEPWWKEFLKKFKDPIIVILLIALALSIAVACYEYITVSASARVFLEPLGILIAVLLATVVGFCFELSANKKFEVLNQVNDDTLVKVIRNSNFCQLAKREVVVGDIVVLETGEEVPADGELLEAISLQINESTLTGEPVCKKTVHVADFDSEATYPSNHALKGTTVQDGHGVMRVMKVGDATEYGKVYEGAQIDDSVETPLNIQLNGLAKLITRASYIIAALIVIGRLCSYVMSYQASFNWLDVSSYALQTVMIAVTVIVVAVPEGLPMSVTLSLALSMKRMLSTNNLVRKMHACETMGAATVICTDKTGTLTQNRMTVFEFVNCHSVQNKPVTAESLTDIRTLLTQPEGNLLVEGISVNSTAYLDFSNPDDVRPLGNPTESALLLWLNDNGVNYLTLRENAEIVEQLTFSTERKYMATIVKSPLLNRKVMYVKGAPEIIIDLCYGSSKSSDRELIEAKLLAYQSKAMRTLALAYMYIEDDVNYFIGGKIDTAVLGKRIKSPDGSVGLNLLGIVAISDPVRQEVPSAVASCLAAGIDVKIVTGDTPGTAKEIGRQIGLWSRDEPESHHLSGTEFAAASDETLLESVLELKILSRARPADKQRLVQLLRRKGQVVAVTGDGTNDAPALNVAQVGLSMGDGTSVAKEASDITIIDNSFSSITRAVMWGRSLYQNIQRFILFQMTINVAACIIVLTGAFLGTESPLTVTQMLWVNLIMDTFAALALASLPPDKRVMQDKPRQTTDFIINTKMKNNIIGVGAFFVVLLFGLLQYFKSYDVGSLADFSVRNLATAFFNFKSTTELTPYELSIFFTVFVMLQFWNMFNAKAFMTGKSAFAYIDKCKGFLLIAALIFAGQWLIVTFGGEMFNVVPLKVADWGIIVAATSVTLWIPEMFRMYRMFKVYSL